jgi:hypothetical protein
MKKIITILATTLIVSVSFASIEPLVSNQAVNTFNSEFAGATNATWTINKHFYQVTFTMDGQQMFAYYNKSGEFLAVSHNISSVELPNSLKKGLKKVMSDRWITDLFEITNNDQTSRYVTIESADEKIVLKSENGGKWRLFQTIEKI